MQDHMEQSTQTTLDHLRLLRELALALDGWPAELAAFAYDYEVFGSWSIIIGCEGARTRFAFDGKGGYLTAHRLTPHPWDLREPPKPLGSMNLPGGLADGTLPLVLEFMRAHAGGPGTGRRTDE